MRKEQLLHIVDIFIQVEGHHIEDSKYEYRKTWIIQEQLLHIVDIFIQVEGHHIEDCKYEYRKTWIIEEKV